MVTWQEQFHAALAQAIFKRGRPVRGAETKWDLYYGWSDLEATEHIRQCTLGEHGKPKEESWSEFQGTFHSGSDIKYGIEMECSCACGEWSGAIRWDENFGEALRMILMEDV